MLPRLTVWLLAVGIGTGITGALSIWSPWESSNVQPVPTPLGALATPDTTLTEAEARTVAEKWLAERAFTPLVSGPNCSLQNFDSGVRVWLFSCRLTRQPFAGGEPIQELRNLKVYDLTGQVDTTR